MDPQTQDLSQQVQESSSVASDVSSQIVSAIQGGKNILVTVSTNPSVDELAAALGFTFLLSKLDKHATAVFSGKIPPAMEFLSPEKTFEGTVDSLRDFIIALDKEKADKLRYKVEDDVVKVFITPYKTIINEKDLHFSQGDFNVDVVIALGVAKRDDLDKAIISHGRILHDASVIAVTSGALQSSLGAINWNDAGASSVSEMLVALSNQFGGDLLDPQISTAFLTGIVAETSRFSNDKTSPKVMNIAAQLMAAGANQQLVASSLRHEGVISEPVRSKNSESPAAHDDGGEMVLDHGSKSTNKDSTGGGGSSSRRRRRGQSSSKPSEGSSAAQTDTKRESVQPQEAAKQPQSDHVAEPAPKQPDVRSGNQGAPGLEVASQPVTPSPVQAAVSEVEPPATAVSAGEPSGFDSQVSSVPEPAITPLVRAEPMGPPAFGGTLSATTSQAEADKAAQAERESAVNQGTLSHDASAANDSAAIDAIEEARRAVEAAEDTQDFNPAHNPAMSIGSQPLEEVVAPQSMAPAPVPQLGDVPQQSPNEVTPVDAFMQSHVQPQPAPIMTPQLPPMPGGVDQAQGATLPPLPPMPPMGSGQDVFAGAPPLPPMPGQALGPTDASTAMQPQTGPDFMQGMPQSQNQWTQAGDEVAARQAEKEAVRQQKIEEIGQQYDQAVDQNRELQGLPPANDLVGDRFRPN